MKHRLIYNSSTKKFELFDLNGVHVTQVNLFLHSLQVRGLSEHTVRSYGFDLMTLFTWLQSTNKQLKEITTATLLEFVSDQKNAKLSPKTINRRLTTIGVFYRFNFGCEVSSSDHHPASSSYYKNSGKEQTLGLHNRKKHPSHKLKVKEPKRLIEPLQPHEVKVFLRSLKRYRDLVIVYLMLLCGLRSMEIRDLRWDDINTFEMKFKVRGKGNKERILPLPDIIREAFEKYKLIEYPKENTSNLAFVCLQGINRGKALKPAEYAACFVIKEKYQE